jgi:predicted transglutaminase-like cysteine proteinase
MMWLGRLFLVLAVGTAVITPALADLATGRDAQPTAAFTEFCRRAPDECAPAEPAKLLATNELHKRLSRVNRRVNRDVRHISDLEHWGLDDRWDYPVDGQGDCEDLALEKRRRLIAKGIPAGAIYFAVVLDPWGQGHAVLMVQTDRGQFVLDTLSDVVTVAETAPHTFLKRSTADPQRWVEIRP